MTLLSSAEYKSVYLIVNTELYSTLLTYGRQGGLGQQLILTDSSGQCSHLAYYFNVLQLHGPYYPSASVYTAAASVVLEQQENVIPQCLIVNT